MKTKFHLTSQMFNLKEQLLLEQGDFSASTFQFDSGVPAIRLGNGCSELIMLPFQGQQIWSATFGGRNVTMHSMFDQPNPTQDYLQTYGAFLIHCGFTAMGVPTSEDTHPLHGELPNAIYRNAYVILGEDEKGTYIALGGTYKHTVAFTYNYLAEPLVKLYTNENCCHIDFTATNLMSTPMEYMYMAHINFLPAENGKLVYSAQATPEHVRVRTSIPPHVKPYPEYLEFIEALKIEPERHHILAPELCFDPEIVFDIDYQADHDGWAHAMQIHQDGSADYISHRPDQLGIGVRWICRMADQQAIGITLPATAGPEGYLVEKEKGNIKLLDGGAQYNCQMVAGLLSPGEASVTEQAIHAIL